MQQPIGIFDSGIGGTSIWKEISSLLPNENTIYLADSAHAPYGEKTPIEIIEFSKRNTEYLLQQNCKLIVVACNTATTNAIKTLRKKYAVPFIGIEPAIKPAALQTKTNSIGILATKGTLSSALFSDTASTFASDVEVVEQVGKGLVQLIESGKMYSDEMSALLKQYLNPMLKKRIDHLVLGCTHYPYLIPQIRQILGQQVTIIDSGRAVAKQTKSILEQNDLLNNSALRGRYEFYSNGNLDYLQEIITKNNPKSKSTFCNFKTIPF